MDDRKIMVLFSGTRQGIFIFSIASQTGLCVHAAHH